MRIVVSATLWLAASLPLLAQPVISVEQDPYHQLSVVETPWELSDELRGRLAERAAEYEATTEQLEVRATTQRVKYPRRSGRTEEQAPRDATFLLSLDDGAIVPLKGPVKQFGRSGKQKVPPVHDWMQLVAAHNQRYFGYRDLGQVDYAYGKARKIQFRGSLPFEDGTDIRQWEGTVLVDAFTMLPIALEAQQRSLWPQLEHQRDVYMRSFKFGFFGFVVRFKKRPIGQRLAVRFGKLENGLTLPVDTHVERVEKVSPDQAVVRSRVSASLEHRLLAPGEQ
jgi:hypothetical protein